MALSLRGRMFWSVAIPLLLLFMVTALAAEQWFGTRLVRAWQAENLPKAVLAADLLDARLRTIASGVLTLAGTLGVEGRGREVLAAWLERDPLLIQVAYVERDSDGATRAAFRNAGETQWQAAADGELAPWLRALVKRAGDLNGPAWLLPEASAQDGPPRAWILVPVSGEGPTAWLGAALDLAALPVEAPAPVASLHFTVLGPGGVFVTHRDPAMVLNAGLLDLAREWQWPELTELDRLLRSGDAGVVRLARFAHQEPHWVFFAPMASTGWTFAAAVPEDEALAAQRALLLEGGVVLAALLVAILLLVALVAGVLARPLGRLTDALGRVLGDGAAAHRGDEVVVVAEAVREMGRRLRSGHASLDELQTAREQLARERDEALAARHRVEQERADLDARLDGLQGQVSEAAAERDALQAARAACQEERDRLAAQAEEAAARLAELERRQATGEGVEDALLRECRRLQYASGPVRRGQWGACCRGEPAAARLFWDRAPAPGGRVWTVGGTLAAGTPDAVARLLVLRLYLVQQAGGAEDPLHLLEAALDWWRQGHEGEPLPELVTLLQDQNHWRFAVTRGLDLYLVEPDGGVEPARERFAIDGQGRRAGEAQTGERVVVPITGGRHQGAPDEALRVLLTTHAALDPGPLAEMVADSLVGAERHSAACCLVLGQAPPLAPAAPAPSGATGAFQRLTRVIRKPGGGD